MRPYKNILDNIAQEIYKTGKYRDKNIFTLIKNNGLEIYLNQFSIFNKDINNKEDQILGFGNKFENAYIKNDDDCKTFEEIFKDCYDFFKDRNPNIKNKKYNFKNIKEINSVAIYIFATENYKDKYWQNKNLFEIKIINYEVIITDFIIDNDNEYC